MKKVLLIEPDRLLASIYAGALKEAGYKVSYATSAQSAIQVADKVKPDLIILEIQLIEHSGIEFMYELRSYVDWQDIPIIINSIVPPAEFNGNHDLLTGELGVVGYLYKPQSSLKQLLAMADETNLVTP